LRPARAAATSDPLVALRAQRTLGRGEQIS
jgi:hypothetical protein